MKKVVICVLTTFILTMFSNISSVTVEASAFTPNFDVKSGAVYMKNLDTGMIVYQKNQNESLSPASLTKIMTAIVVLEEFQGNLDALKTTYISAGSLAFDELYLTGASTADFRINEKLSYSDLLYGLMLRSACEAANIMAYNLGDGDMNKFVDMMNEKAAELGATNTTFTNAHGLYDEGMRTTAADMGIISEYAINLPGFMEIAGSASHTLEKTDFHEEREIYHTNSMLLTTSPFYYKYAKGIKTGTLDEAGSCLITTASKDGYQYLVVTLNAPIYNSDGSRTNDNFKDHTALYDWAFENFQYTKLIDKNEEISEVKVEYSADGDFVIVKPSADHSQLWQTNIDIKSVQRVVKLQENVIAPIKEGDKLGELELKFAGEQIATIDLVAAKDIERSKISSTIAVAKNFTKSIYFKIGLYAVIGIVAIYTILFIYFRVEKARKRKIRRKPIKRSRR